MKKGLFNFLIIIPVFMLSLACGDVCADTLFLKSGRIIKCTDIKKENSVIKCFVDGYEIGFPADEVEKIHLDDKSGKKQFENGFTFDHWHSGMNIEEVMIAAERNDVALHQPSFFSANKHYNPKMSGDYIATATEFSYRDHLMGKDATVTLCFTPKSKLLEKIKIRLFSNDIKHNSSYPREIEKMLSEKYGKPSRIIDLNIVHDSVSWKGNNNFTVLMSTGIGLIDIIYTDNRLQLIGQNENNSIKAKNSEQYHLKDAGKF